MTKEIYEKIINAKKVLLITHVNPDGDTLGSACAMKEFLGEKADILVQTNEKTGVPYNYKFLAPLKEAKFLDTVQDEYDLLIALDVASIDRIVEFPRKIFDKSKNTINIDHHKTNKGYAKLNLVKGGYSSTGEVLYDFFNELNIKISLKMAEALYAAILTDTGCFKYETVTKDTFLAVSKLLETGIDTSEIAKKCYDNKPKNMIIFQADVISNAKFALNGRAAYAIITTDIMKKYNVKNEHTEGIAETLRSISNVDISIVLKENSDKTTKASLRSKTIDLTPVVEKFNGGGHKMAAGCTIKKHAACAVELILDEIAKCIK
ncbi:MAG: bifunctional oligoribonuclease/PAP phosphatase NrnA [Candidatus Gastranaerophilales bacterium]|nr:bifunctional oligoribonuclease/PAP phosphatase NrnA [Candidatus Gastranaerophilales bacterium]